MKRTRTIFTTMCILAASGLAVCLVHERQARLKLNDENNALRRQLSQTDELLAENRRLSNLLAEASASASQATKPVEETSRTDERAKELARLRGEVETLRRQSKELDALREDTRRLEAARQNALKTQNAGMGMAGNGMTANGSQLEILTAEYWTANTNMDVADELRDRIRGGRLKAVASNNLKGDPEFGKVKNLTVIYRFGGVTHTNHFRENDLVILPPE